MALKAAVIGLAAILSANTANAQETTESDSRWSISIGANYRQNRMGSEVDRDMAEMDAGYSPVFAGFKPIGVDPNFFNMTLTLKRDFPITDELGMRAVLWLAGMGGLDKDLYDETYALCIPPPSGTQVGDARITFNSGLVGYFNASLGAEFYYRPFDWLYVHTGVLAGVAYLQTDAQLQTILIAEPDVAEDLRNIGIPSHVNVLTESSGVGWSTTLYAGLEFRFYDFGVYTNAGYVFEEVELQSTSNVYLDEVLTEEKERETLQQNWGPFAELGLSYYF
ncbi:MAG: hypothetical protein WC852_06145 [Candidatus Nanoarchaeia archaeon]|jgi:hypothetical protein